MSPKRSFASAKDSNAVLAAKASLGVLFQAPFLFITAGTWYWLEGWLYLLLFECYAIPTVFYLKRHTPELLERRSTYKFERGWDRLLIIGSSASIMALYIVAPLDAVRYGWSQVPPAIKVAGFAGMGLSLAALFLIMKENSYLFRTVKVEKGQKVITTGPYGIVRHPMYAAFTFMFFCIPLALGSYYALIPVVLTVPLLIIRTHLEDKDLHKELPGYKEYAKKTRYRLLPYVW